MKSKSLFFLFCFTLGGLVHPIENAQAELIDVTTTLRDLGMERRERLLGTQVAKEFFFPLPVRNIEAGLSSVRFRVSASPLIDPQSSVAIQVNGVNIAESFVRQDRESFTVEAMLPTDVLASIGAENFLNISLAANLIPPEGKNRCNALAVGALWIEIHPDSAIRWSFDNHDPDWLSIARLPFNLRRQVFFTTEGEMDDNRRDIMLKVATWLAYTSPESSLINEESEMAFAFRHHPIDEFVFLPAEDEGASIRIEPDGANRKIFVTATTREENLSVWTALRKLDRHRVPGSHWERLVETGRTLIPDRSSAIILSQLAPDFVGFNQGIGEVSRSFLFDMAVFGSQPGEVLLRLKGLHKEFYRTGAATLMVYLNNRLVFTRDFPTHTTDFDLIFPLDIQLLRGLNEVRVTVNFSPSMEECQNPLFLFFWQIDPASQLLFDGDRPKVDVPDLVQAAQTFFGRTRYDMLIHQDADFPTALHLVMWLQRVNSSALIEPWLTQKALPLRPLLAVGNFPQAPPGVEANSLEMPVVRDESSLRFVQQSGWDFFEVETTSSVGVLQLGYRGVGQPVIWASGWGPAGSTALSNMSKEIANLPWFGEGDILIGDGLVPIMAMSSRDVQLGEIYDRRAIIARLQWMQWRWWIVGGIWLLLTGIVIWIFSQSRRHSKL